PASSARSTTKQESSLGSLSRSQTPQRSGRSAAMTPPVGTTLLRSPCARQSAHPTGTARTSVRTGDTQHLRPRRSRAAPADGAPLGRNACSRSRAREVGIDFARARTMGDALPRRSYLGFEVTAEGPDEAPRWRVSEIDADSPAARADLRLGDEVLSLDGTPLQSLADLRRRAARLPAERSAVLVVRRGELEVSLSLVPAPMPLEPLRSGRVVLDEVPWRLPEGETVRLRAVWTLPDAPGPHPAVWILPSAAWISQETPLDTWDPTYQLIDRLTAAGIATLRVDRSGLGDSEGPPCTELDFEHELSM